MMGIGEQFEFEKTGCIEPEPGGKMDNRMLKTEHQKRVEAFMRLVGQDVLTKPTIPTTEVRLLRAKLILEEALETVKALGVEILLRQNVEVCADFDLDSVELFASGQPDLIQIADGCADVSVVTIGTLSACGIADGPLLKEVDDSNMRKFGPGGYHREDGKWCKPDDWTPPNIQRVLKDQE